MRILHPIVVTSVLVGALPAVHGQLEKDEVARAHETGGFAETVSQVCEKMRGKWIIKSATLNGADLPLDQFELLTVDAKGMTLCVQNRKTRFEFTDFELEAKRLLARSSSLAHPKRLIYEVSISDGLIKIRYRTNGADIAPRPSTDDGQLLVQTWKKPQSRPGL